MGEFVSLRTWLAPNVQIVDQAEPIAPEVPAPEPADELIEDVCARVRRFRAMLDDACSYVQERGTPAAPLTVRVHPARMRRAEHLGLPLVADAALHEEDAVLELRCGSIDARLAVPLVHLIEKRDR